MGTTLSDRMKLRIRELLEQGLTTTQVARRLTVPRGSVSAIKANMTRGAYGASTTRVRNTTTSNTSDSAKAYSVDIQLLVKADSADDARSLIENMTSATPGVVLPSQKLSTRRLAKRDAQMRGVLEYNS